MYNVFFNVSSVFRHFLALLRHSFLGIAARPLANCLGPNPYGCCSPLSLEVLVVSTCLTFSKLCLSSIMPFFLVALCYVFLRVFPEFPSYNCLFSLKGFLQLPWVFHAFLQCNGFFTTFHNFSSIPLLFFKMFLHFPSFSLVFSHLFPSLFSGPRGNRTATSPNCLVAHAPLKQKSRPNHHLISRFLAYWATSSPDTPYIHFVRENNFA